MENKQSILKQKTNRKNESGNVIFYIFLLVFLVGLLSYTVSRNSRTSTSTLTAEQARLAATEILEYGDNVAKAVQKLRLRGCSDTEISFSNAVVSGYSYDNGLSDESCHVFSSEGGNVTFRTPEDSWLDTSLSAFDHAYCPYKEIYYTGENTIPSMGTTCNDDTCKELLLVLEFVHKDVCVEINERLSIANDYNTDWPPAENTGGTAPGSLQGDKFIGTYFNGPLGVDGGVDGAATACLTIECTGTGSPDYTMFYQTLIAR